MTKFPLVFAVAVLCVIHPSQAPAAIDPGDRFLEAYFLIQDGDAAMKQADWTQAAAKFNGALEILRELKFNMPEWNPHIIDFRIKYCTDHLADLQDKFPPPPPPPVEPPMPTQPVYTPPVTIPAQPVSPEEAERIQQLTAELERAREQVSRLETTRDELQSELQEALSKIAPTETSPQVEELLKENQRLATQLAASQTEVAELRERAAAPPPAPPVLPVAPAEPEESPELIRLRAELTEVRAELVRTKQELQQSREELVGVRRDLETARAESTGLRRSYDEIVGQLTDANRRLRAAQIASEKDDEIIRQLRKENALLQVIANRKAISPRQTEEAGGPTIPELKGWRPRRRAQAAAAAAQQAEESPTSTGMEESAHQKLVATLTAPPSPAQPVEQLAPAIAQEPAATSPAVRSLLQEARAALALGDFEDASAKYDTVLGMEPENVVALSNLGVVRYRQGRLEEAEQTLRRAAAIAPNDSASRALLGVVYFRKGRLDDAYNELTRAVALDPRNAEAHNYLGITLSEKGWGPAAEQEIRRAIELNPQYADAHFNLAVLYARQRTPRYELARYHYEKARDLGAAPDPQIEELLKQTTQKTEAQKPAPQPVP